MIKTLFQTALTDTKTTDVEGIGRLRFEDDGKVYRWVKNAESSTTLAQYQACCYTISTTSSLTQTVKIPLTANLGAFAGSVMATAGIAAASYGWIQVKGEGTISVDGTSAIAAGDNLKAVNTTTALVKDTAVGTAPIYRKGAQCLVAYSTASAANTAVYLDAL